MCVHIATASMLAVVCFKVVHECIIAIEQVQLVVSADASCGNGSSWLQVVYLCVREVVLLLVAVVEGISR